MRTRETRRRWLEARRREESWPVPPVKPRRGAVARVERVDVAHRAVDAVGGGERREGLVERRGVDGEAE